MENNMSEICSWKAPATLTIYEVSELPTVLDDIATQGKSWSIDLADIVEIDSCGCQLLMLMEYAAISSENKIEFINADDALRNHFNLFGAGSILDNVSHGFQASAQIEI
jgi:ABC-type transporter Mla MlaB component